MVGKITNALSIIIGFISGAALLVLSFINGYWMSSLKYIGYCALALIVGIVVFMIIDPKKDTVLHNASFVTIMVSFFAFIVICCYVTFVTFTKCWHFGLAFVVSVALGFISEAISFR